MLLLPRPSGAACRLMQRKPRGDVAVSMGCAIRAAGPAPPAVVGAHRWEPPFITLRGIWTPGRAGSWLPSRSPPRGFSSRRRPVGPASSVAVPVAGPLPDVAGHVEQAVAVGRGTNRRVRCPRGHPPRCCGGGTPPCQVFAIHWPPGVNSSPQGVRGAVQTPRAAYSHSASVGSSLPGPLCVPATSSQATWTTGCSGSRFTELPGPCGCRQLAPGT